MGNCMIKCLERADVVRSGSCIHCGIGDLKAREKVSFSEGSGNVIL